MRVLTFGAGELTLRDVERSVLPFPGVGMIDSPTTQRFRDVAMAFVCVERGDNRESIILASRHIRSMLQRSSASSFVIVPFFHLSNRAVVPLDERAVHEVHDVFRAVAAQLRDVGVQCATFGFHKEMITTGLRLAGSAGTLFRTQDRRTPGIELVMCRSVLGKDRRFWVFAWDDGLPHRVRMQKIVKDIRRHWERFADSQERIVVSEMPGVSRAGLALDLAQSLGCDYDDLTQCDRETTRWCVVAAHGSVVYRSY